MVQPEIPVRAGYTFLGWYINKNYEGLPLFSLSQGNTISLYEIKAAAEIISNNEIILYAKWKPVFSQPDDVFPFNNSRTYFRSMHYEMKDSDFNLLCRNEEKYSNSNQQAASLKSCKYAKWEGSCFGMSCVACLAEANKINLMNYAPHASKLSDLMITYNKHGDLDVGAVESLVNFYQLSQFLQNSSGGISVTTSYDTENDSIDDLINKMKEDNKPVLILIRISDVGGHAVVGYDMKYDEVNQTYTIKIYDPSYPGDISLQIRHTALGYEKECSEWEERWGNSIIIAETATADEICNGFEKDENGIPFRLMAEDKANYDLDVNYDEFSISDGTNTTKILDGVIVGEDKIGIIECGLQNEVGYEKEWLFKLPELKSGGKYDIKVADLGYIEYNTKLIDNSTQDGFCYIVNSDTNGNMSIDSNQCFTTQYGEAANEEITFVSNLFKNNWNCAKLDASGKGLTIKPLPSEKDYLITAADKVNSGVTVSTLYNDWRKAENITIDNQGIKIKDNSKVKRGCVIEIPNGSDITDVLGYSVIFKSNGGSSVLTQNDIAPGELAAEPETPKREGMLFTGWYTDEELTDEWDFDTSKVNEDTVLYAAWMTDPGYYRTVVLSVNKQPDQTILVRKGDSIDKKALDKMYDIKGKINWNSEDIKLLSSPVTANLNIRGTIGTQSEDEGEDSDSGRSSSDSDKGGSGGGKGGSDSGDSGKASIENTTYNVNLPNVMTNGVLTASSKIAPKGETIIITATPAEGYKMNTITVTDTYLKNIVLKNLGNNQYSFVMPDSNVNVKVEFIKDPDIDDKGSISSPAFTDVKKDSYYEEAVAWAVEKEITTGTSSTTFSPDQGCTRGQVVTFLWRAAGSPEAQKSSFTDVKSGSYYEQAVSWAVEKGITNGTRQNKFSPDDVCTRAQIVTFLARFDEMKDTGTQSTFRDVPVDSYYAAAVKWAVDNNITTGTSATTFSPNDNCTRAHTVTFLYRLCGNR